MRDLENPESLDLNMSPVLLLGCGVVGVFCCWFYGFFSGGGGGGCVLISFIPCMKFRSSYLGKLFGGGLILFILCGKFGSSYLGQLFWAYFIYPLQEIRVILSR